MERMFDFIRKVLAGSNEAEVKKLMKIADQVDALENKMKALSDEALREQTQLFRNRLEKAKRWIS